MEEGGAIRLRFATEMAAKQAELEELEEAMPVERVERVEREVAMPSEHQASSEPPRADP